MPSIVNMFENIVSEYSERVALVCGTERFTYLELHEEVVCWADTFASVGIGLVDWVREHIQRIPDCF